MAPTGQTLTSWSPGRQRLVSQRISAQLLETPEDVVRWMGALQAQDYQQALWAIGVRTRSATMAEVEQAVAEARIIRTWPMRGTIHFVLPEDARWMLQLSAARTIAADRRRQSQLGIDEDILKRSAKVLSHSLKDGRPVSRPDLMADLEAAGIATTGQRGYHILWYLSQTGLTCLGPLLGKQQSFVLLDAWAPRSRELSREESLAELAGRYTVGHGPATVHDFAGWAGLIVADARRGLEAADPALISEVAEGKTYWRSSRSPHGPFSDQTVVHLLPGFDEFLLGYKDRSEVLAPEHATRVVPGGNGIFFPMVVVGGQVVATWKRTVRKDGVDILIKPFSFGHPWEASVMEPAKRYCTFLGLNLTSVTFDES
jgi:hypothetical protein